MESKLYRLKNDRIIAGVCAGLSEYLKIDVVIIRLIFVLLALAHGSGVLIYIILAIIIPEKDGRSYAEDIGKNIKDKDKDKINQTIKKAGDEIKNVAGKSPSRRAMFASILIVLGLVFLAQNLLPAYLSFNKSWPLLLVIAGVVILLSSKRKE